MTGKEPFRMFTYVWSGMSSISCKSVMCLSSASGALDAPGHADVLLAFSVDHQRDKDASEKYHRERVE